MHPPLVGLEGDSVLGRKACYRMRRYTETGAKRGGRREKAG